MSQFPPLSRMLLACRLGATIQIAKPFVCSSSLLSAHHMEFMEVESIRCSFMAVACNVLSVSRSDQRAPRRRQLLLVVPSLPPQTRQQRDRRGARQQPEKVFRVVHRAVLRPRWQPGQRHRAARRDGAAAVQDQAARIADGM